MIQVPHYYDDYKDPTPYKEGVGSLALCVECVWRVVSYEEEHDDEYGVLRISSYYKLAYLFGPRDFELDLAVRVRCRGVELLNEMEAIAHVADMTESNMVVSCEESLDQKE